MSGVTVLNERRDALGHGQRISDGQDVSLLWSTLAAGPIVIGTTGGTAFAINAGGLITGRRSTVTGAASVWRDTTFLGELPLPGGVTRVSELFVMGDDNSLFSEASGYGPVRWSCRLEVGDPS